MEVDILKAIPAGDKGVSMKYGYRGLISKIAGNILITQFLISFFFF